MLVSPASNRITCASSVPTNKIPIRRGMVAVDCRDQFSSSRVPFHNKSLPRDVLLQAKGSQASDFARRRIEGPSLHQLAFPIGLFQQMFGQHRQPIE